MTKPLLMLAIILFAYVFYTVVESLNTMAMYKVEFVDEQ